MLKDIPQSIFCHLPKNFEKEMDPRSERTQIYDLKCLWDLSPSNGLFKLATPFRSMEAMSGLQACSLSTLLARQIFSCGILEHYTCRETEAPQNHNINECVFLLSCCSGIGAFLA
jgi:hypothetical protein